MDIDEEKADATLNAKILSSVGYHEMSLSAEAIADKAELRGTIEALAEKEADVDYKGDTFVILADTKKEAEDIADCYGATLISFNYGVGEASVDFSDENALLSANPSYEDIVPNDIVDIFKIAADDNNFPVIYPNIKYHILDNVEATSEELLNASPYGDYEAAQASLYII